MTDVPARLLVRAGDGSQPSIDVMQDPTGGLTPQYTIRLTDGSQVGPENPLPVVTTAEGALPGVYSTQAEASHVLKAAPGVLFSLQANSMATGWILLFDETTVPANGTVSPRKAWQIDAAVNQTLDRTFNPPLQMASGAVVVFSVTGPFLLTLGASVAQFSGEIV